MTVTAHVCVRNASSASNSGRSALDVVHRVNEPRVQLDLSPADDANGARHTDPALVVAVHVRAHRELGLLLARREELSDAFRILDRIATAGDGSGNRTRFDAVLLDAHVHLRGGADEILFLPEVEKKCIGSRVSLAESSKNGRWRRLARLAKGLAQDDLEEIAALESGARLLDRRCVLSGAMIRARSHTLGGHVSGFHPIPRKRACRLPVDLEIVRIAHRALFPMIHDDELVRQVEDHVALVIRATLPEFNGLELKREIVAEGAVQPEVDVVGAPEDVDDGAEHREDAGLLAALLLGDALRRGSEHRSESVSVTGQ